MVELLVRLKEVLCGSKVSSLSFSSIRAKCGLTVFKTDPAVGFVIPGNAAALAEEVLNDSELDKEKVEEVEELGCASFTISFDTATTVLSFPFGSPVDGVPLPEIFDRVDSDIQRLKKERERERERK